MARSSTPFSRDNDYVWAVYRWDEQSQRFFAFERYWEKAELRTMRYAEVHPPLYPLEAMRFQQEGPPRFDSPFNSLVPGQTVMFIRYPAPCRIYVIYDSDDARFNVDLER